MVHCLVALIAKAARPLTLSEIKARIDSLCTQHPSKCPQGWPHGISNPAAMYAAKHGLPRSPNISMSVNRAGEPVYTLLDRPTSTSATASAAPAPAPAARASRSTSASAIEVAVAQHLVAALCRKGRPLAWYEIDNRLRAGCGQPAGYFDSAVPVKISFEAAQLAASMPTSRSWCNPVHLMPMEMASAIHRNRVLSAEPALPEGKSNDGR